MIKKYFFPLLAILTVAVCFGEAMPQPAAKKAFVFQIDEDYWRIAGTTEWRRGERYALPKVDLETGKTCRVEGRLGWSFNLSLDALGSATVADVAAGEHVREAPAVKLEGSTLRVKMPRMYEVTLDVPFEYFQWDLAGVGRFAGRITVRLPEGKYEIAGCMGWKARFSVSPQQVTLEQVEDNRYGLKTADIIVNGRYLGFPAARTERVYFDIPVAYGEWSLDRILPWGSGFRACRLPEGKYEVVGKTGWKACLEMDKSGLKAGGTTLAGPFDDAKKLEIKGFQLRLADVPPTKTEPASQKMDVSLEIPKDRQYFRRGEDIEFYLRIVNPLPESGILPVKIVLADDRGELDLWNRSIPAAPGRNVFSWQIASAALREGDYCLAVTAGKQRLEKKLSVVPALRETSFIINVYGGFTQINADAPLAQIKAAGFNLLAGQSEFNYWSGYRSPEERMKYLDRLVKYNFDVLGQFSSAHQLYHYGTCFLDPELQKAAIREGGLSLQFARQYPVFKGINWGDEAGTGRWADNVDYCPYCESVFESKSGFKRPDNTGNQEAWRAWQVFKQEQRVDFFKKAGARIPRIKSGMWTTTQDGNLNLFSIDSGYPPLTLPHLDVAPFHWYAEDSTLWTVMGIDYCRLWDSNTPPLWPFVNAVNLNEGIDKPAVPGYVLNQVNLAVARKVEGLGYFWWSPAISREPQYSEIKQINARLTRYGNLFLSLKRDRSREVAVLSSFTELINRFGEEKDPGNACAATFKYVNEVNGAFYSLLRAHIPAGIISEEDILQQRLNQVRGLVLVGQRALPEKVREAIEKYVGAGGAVFVDSTTTAPIKGARVLKSPLADLGAIRASKLADDYRYTKDWIKEMSGVFTPHASSLAQSDEPRLIVAEQYFGDGQYVFLVNDNQTTPAKQGNLSGIAEFLPLQTRVKFNKGAKFVYDVFARQRVLESGDEMALAFAPGEMKLFAFLPAPVEKVTLRSSGDTVEIKVVDQGGKPIKAALPIEIVLADSLGKERYRLYRSAENGEFRFALPVAVNDAPGPWQVKVLELCSGREIAGQIAAKNSLSLKAVIKAQPDYRLLDKTAAREFLQTKKELWIVIGSKDAEGAAGYLRDKLSKQGLKAEVKYDAEVMLRYEPLMDLGYGIARVPEDVGSPYWRIDQPLILFGTSRLTSEIQRFREGTEGTIQYLWKPFSLDEDVLIMGADLKSVDFFLKEIDSRK